MKSKKQKAMIGILSGGAAFAALALATRATHEEPTCTPGSTRCNGDTLEECNSDGTGWNAIKTCTYGCENGQCNPAPECTVDSDCGTDYWQDSGQRQWVSATECTEKEQKLMQLVHPYCSGGNCSTQITSTQWEDTGAIRNKADGTACSDGECVDGVCQPTDPCAGVDCGADYLEDTGQRQWVSATECTEKEQKEMQSIHPYCSGGSCYEEVTQTEWVDTGATRNKADGTSCSIGECQDGVCVDITEPGDAIANYDISTHVDSSNGMDYDGSDLIIANANQDTILIFNKTGGFQWESNSLFADDDLRGVCYTTPHFWCVGSYLNKLYKYDIVSSSIIEEYDLSFMGRSSGISAHINQTTGEPWYLFVLDEDNFKIYRSTIHTSNYDPGNFTEWIDLNPLKTAASSYGLSEPNLKDLWQSKTSSYIYISDDRNNCIWYVHPDSVPDRYPLMLNNPDRADILPKGIIFDGTNFYIADGYNPDTITSYKPYSGTYY